MLPDSFFIDFLFGDIAMLIDMGFVILVVASCSRALLSQDSKLVDVTNVCKEELGNLEQTLEALVAEAAAASRNLDRQLLSRKQELERLLFDLQQTEFSIQSQEANQTANMPRSINDPNFHESRGLDLPNASWLLDDACANSRGQKSNEHLRGIASRENRTEYDELLTTTKDQVSLSNVKMNVASNSLQEAPLMEIPLLVPSDVANRSRLTEQSVLTDQIEMIKSNTKSDFTDDYGDELVGVDNVTFNVARRLLASGQEVHRVAKKLDVPVGQVRAIERHIKQSERRSIN